MKMCYVLCTEANSPNQRGESCIPSVHQRGQLFDLDLHLRSDLGPEMIITYYKNQRPQTGTKRKTNQIIN